MTPLRHCHLNRHVPTRGSTAGERGTEVSR